MGAVEFSVMGTVLLKRPTSVAEVVGWVSSETVGEDTASETSFDCSRSTGSYCSMLLTTGHGLCHSAELLTSESSFLAA